MTEAQNGFRKGKCIETAVQSFIKMIQVALDKRVHTIGIFIDLTKPYDVLNHKLLLEKLSSYAVVYREGGFGVFKPPLKFRRYRWSPRWHKQVEPASQFPFAVHCVLIRL